MKQFQVITLLIFQSQRRSGNITLSADSEIFYYKDSNNLLQPTAKITVDGDEIFELWKKRTGVVYTKMNRIWNTIRSTTDFTETEAKFSSETSYIELAKAISAQTKLNYIEYAIVTNKINISDFPYKLIDEYGYNVDDLNGTISDDEIVNSFVSKITGNVPSLFNFE